MIALIATYVVGALAVLIGLRMARSAWRARAIVRRLDACPTCMAAALEVGPAEVSGTLRTLDEPLRTFDGKPALAIETLLTRHYQRNGKSVRSNVYAYRQLDAGRLELGDASGRCPIEVEHTLLVGPRFEASYDGSDFERAWPELFAGIAASLTGGAIIDSVDVVQTYLPEGAVGFAAGEGVAGDDGRCRLTGREDAPLILASYPEATVRRYMGRPSLVLAWMAALFFILGVALLALPSLLDALTR